MAGLLWFMCLAVISLQSGCHAGPTHDTIHDVLGKYKAGGMSVAPPAKNGGDVVVVNLGLAIIKARISRHGELTADVWLRMLWSDYSLQWDPTKYDKVTTIRVPSEDIWTPDITLYNGDMQLDASTSRQAVVYSGGSVLWLPRATIASDCQRLYNGSFHCQWKFASWVFDASKVDLDYYEGQGNIDLSDFSDLSHNEVAYSSAMKENVQYPCCVEIYPHIMYDFIVNPVEREND